jgi:hypothetical protein
MRTADELAVSGLPYENLRALAGTLPWSPEALSEAVGVPVVAAEDRHTALGDARWARDMYDAVMGTGKPAS